MPAMLVSHCMMEEGRVSSGDPTGVSPAIVSLEEPVSIFEAAFRALDATLKEQVESRIHAARQEVTNLVQRYDVNIVSYTRYGSSEIKTTGCSPDAFVQIAMQLAGYRLFGEQVGMYEATQMRAFLHGRTETTRGVSVASQDFVKAMKFVYVSVGMFKSKFIFSRWLSFNTTNDTHANDTHGRSTHGLHTNNSTVEQRPLCHEPTRPCQVRGAL